ncbi:MAG: hypothetical protein JWM53_6647 [bacterium]|nr:hypothetical protein [bacterium]
MLRSSFPRGLVAVISVAASTVSARAQETEPGRPAAPTAPSPPSSSAAAASTSDVDRRFEELLARQRELEVKVRDQNGVIRTLQEAAAFKPTDSPSAPLGSPRFLAVRPAPPGTIVPEWSAPLAGYSEKNFFFRDRHSWFVLVPKGRLNVDWYNFLNRPPPPTGVLPNSAADPRASLRDTIFIRRARIGLAGTLVHHIDFRVEAEFASLATPGQYATLTDASIVANFTPYVQLEVGQFYAPFTLENPTSENYTDFMEKSAPIRFVVPTARETGAMVLGILPHNAARYWVGVFDGDAQNVKNLDNRPAVIGRGFFAPLALVPRHAPWMEGVWVGASFWWQQVENIAGAGPASTTGASTGDLASVTTQGGFAIFSSNYGNGADAMKNPIRTHLAPDGTVLKYAIELNVPILDRFGLRSEFVHQSMDVRAYNDVNPGTGNLTRTNGPKGFLDGYGAYVEAYAWIGGPVNVDKPGLYQVPHWNGYITPPPPRWAVMLAAKYEHVEFAISGLPQSTNAAGNAVGDPANGHYALDTFELGTNFWVTRHSRVIANYVLNYVGSGDPNQAAALSQKNLFFQKIEHELLFRFAVSL